MWRTMLEKTATQLHRPGTWLDPSSTQEIAHADLMRRMRAKQAVLLGETHDRYDVHRWQLHVLAGLHALDPNIVVGFEMFPRRVQGALDRFVAGDIDTDAFLKESEWDTVWRFDPALYLPIFHFCRQFKVPMKALNCRRELVTEVGKLGWDAIPEANRDGVTPSKPASPAYRDYLFAITGGVREGREAQSGSDPAFDRFVRAQRDLGSGVRLRHRRCASASPIRRWSSASSGAAIWSITAARRSSWPISVSAMSRCCCRRTAISSPSRPASPMRCSG